jgi:hypothetical protein
MFPETYFVKMYLFAIESKQQVGYVEAARSCARSLKTEYGFWLLAIGSWPEKPKLKIPLTAKDPVRFLRIAQGFWTQKGTAQPCAK